MAHKNQERCIRCGEPIPRPLPKDAEPLCDACDDYEEKQPMWSLRFLHLLVSPFLAVGAVLFVIGICLLGFGFVFVGCKFLPTNPFLGWILFTFGVGIWLVMIFKGINALFYRNQ